MLNNIEIQNYRNLKHLRIEKLGRVNLIIGRNNTGKTSLLEAFYLFVNQDEVEAVSNIINNRGERYSLETSESDSEKTLKIVNNLFWDRNKNGTSVIKIESNDKAFILGTRKLLRTDINPPTIQCWIEIVRDKNKPQKFIVFTGSRGELKNIPDERNEVTATINVKFVESTIASSRQNHSNQLAAYHDSIFLEDNYEYVIEALQIIDNNIERVAYLPDLILNERFPVARLKNGERINLLSMGDGINRILAIILTMLNCEDGYLLIDEFENGLHYSVQEKLWEIIFHLAERLNIQVFATTHSSDTIRAFENIVNQNEMTPLDGLLIKLENINDTIKATTFEPGELKIITDNLIEVRR